MKRYKKKKITKPQEVQNILDTDVITVPLIQRTQLNHNELTCPNCNAVGQMIVLAYEANYYKIDNLSNPNEDNFLDWGECVDGEVEESSLKCDNCHLELREEEVWDVTIERLSKKAHYEAIQKEI